MKKNKAFDCVEMKRRGAEYVYSIIKDMTPEEELAYWHQRTELMLQRQAALHAKGPPVPRLPLPGGEDGEG